MTWLKLQRRSHITLRKLPWFHLISWCGNFVERHSFYIVLGESPETMRKLCLFTKFPHQEISWSYGIFRSVIWWFVATQPIFTCSKSLGKMCRTCSKVSNKEKKYFYCQFSTDFTHFSVVFIIDLEPVNAVIQKV